MTDLIHRYTEKCPLKIATLRGSIFKIIFTKTFQMRAIIRAPLLTQKHPPLLILSTFCKKSLLAAKRYAECEVGNQELFTCMQKV